GVRTGSRGRLGTRRRRFLCRCWLGRRFLGRRWLGWCRLGWCRLGWCFLGGSLLRGGTLLLVGLLAGGLLSGLADRCELGADFDGFVFLGLDLEQGSGCRRGDFGVDLIGGDFQ